MKTLLSALRCLLRLHNPVQAKTAFNTPFLVCVRCEALNLGGVWYMPAELRPAPVQSGGRR